MRLVLLLVVVMVPLCAASHVAAQDIVVNIDSVYVDVVVMPTGRVNVTYWIKFSVISGSLGGFDLIGIQENSVYDPNRAYAEMDGVKYDLVVRQVENGYMLDWTPRTQAGDSVTIVFGYFSTNRVLELTTDNEGHQLAVFHWSPVQWEQQVDVENIRVIYPIPMQDSWITAEGGITTEGAEYAGYVEDSRQGIVDQSSGLREFDELDLLAYPSSPSAPLRNFSVSLTAQPAQAYDHLVVFHYVNWTFFRDYFVPGQLAYDAPSYVNAVGGETFVLNVLVYNVGDMPLHDVTVQVAIPDNLTLITGSATTYGGTLNGGESLLLRYEFRPDNVGKVVQLTFIASAQELDPEEYLSFTVSIYIQEVTPPITAPGSVGILVAAGIALAVVGYAYWTVKRPRGAAWTAEDTTIGYESPQITIQTFGAPGTVAELDPVEAAFFENVTRDKLVSMILMSCVKKGAVRVLSTDPLKLSVTGLQFEDLTYYEQMFVDAIVDGELDPDKIDEMIEAIAEKVQEKSWNADFEATKEHHEKVMEEAWQKLESTEDPAVRTQYYFDGTYNGSWAWYWLYMHPGHDHRIRDVFESQPRAVAPAEIPTWFKDLSSATGHA
ncbi:MAG: hypothetical protein ACTSX3_00780, partial [Candidatus Thorarchaeota archaeon]